MGISTEQYRACIGLLNNFRFTKCGVVLHWLCLRILLKYIYSSLAYTNKLKGKLVLDNVHFNAFLVILYFFYSLYALNIILKSWDIESNPGPETGNTLNVFHYWNLNSVWIEDFLKLSLLQDYISINKCDIIFLSETFLDSLMMIQGY